MKYETEMFKRKQLWLWHHRLSAVILLSWIVYRICLKKLYSAKGKWNRLILSYIKGWLILNLLLSSYIVFFFFWKTTKWYHFTSFYVKSNCFTASVKISVLVQLTAKQVSLPNGFPCKTRFPALGNGLEYFCKTKFFYLHLHAF